MLEDNRDLSRLMLQVNKRIREINRETLNPEIPELKLEDLEPLFKLVARTRAAYLKELFSVTKVVGDGLPSPEQLRKLASNRLVYEELREGAEALDIALEREYLDVRP